MWSYKMCYYMTDHWTENFHMLRSHGLKINQRELSKIIGVEWKKLSDELKSPFVEVSKYEKEHHKLMYPDYKFKPNKKKKRSSAQNSVKELSYNKNNWNL